MVDLIYLAKKMAVKWANLKQRDSYMVDCWAYSTMKGSLRAGYLAGMMAETYASLRLNDTRRDCYWDQC